MASLTLMACHEAPADPTADSAKPAPEPGHIIDLPYAPPEKALPSTQVGIARTLKFARQEGGVSIGFDLDGRVSDRSDADSCYQADFVSPDGAEGIDNAFAMVLPLIERVGGTALEGLVQSAINEGDLLVALELDGVDSLTADDEVTITLMRAVAQPFVGTDGLIEPWQTYDIDVEAPWSKVSGRIDDGVLSAADLEFQLPIYVFDFEFLVTVTEGRIEIGLGPDGPEWAVLGGQILMQNLLDIANNIEGGQNIPGTLDTVGRTFADLGRDETGACTALSVTLDIDLAGGFFFEDVARPDR